MTVDLLPLYIALGTAVGLSILLMCVWWFVTVYQRGSYGRF